MRNRVLMLMFSFLCVLQIVKAQYYNIVPQSVDKIELEQLFIERMSDGIPVGELIPVSIVEKYLQPYKADIYIQQGGKLVSDDFRSDIYLRKAAGDSVYNLLFESKYPIESFITLFNSKLHSSIQANVTLVRLDGKRTEKRIALDRLQTMLSEGNSIYSGLYGIVDNQIKITVIYHNSIHQYINMLVATADLNTLFSANALITADLYLCIPREDLDSIN